MGGRQHGSRVLTTRWLRTLEQQRSKRSERSKRNGLISNGRWIAPSFTGARRMACDCFCLASRDATCLAPSEASATRPPASCLDSLSSRLVSPFPHFCRDRRVESLVNAISSVDVTLDRENNQRKALITSRHQDVNNRGCSQEWEEESREADESEENKADEGGQRDRR